MHKFKGGNLKFKKVAVGGTFDHMHDGHKALLRKAFEVGERVVVGICSDEMNLVKDSAGIRPLEERMSKLRDFLQSEGFLERAEIVLISDPFGPALEDGTFDSIVVSGETRPRAEELNRLRAKKGLKELEIVEIPFVLAEDGLPVSSVRIRYGEIDEHGKLLKKSFL
jgi:pantetheine-phosphate adenylyltransferase